MVTRLPLIVFALGLASFSIGLALVYVPAGFVGFGLVLMGISLFGAARQP